MKEDDATTETQPAILHARHFIFSTVVAKTEFQAATSVPLNGDPIQTKWIPPDGIDSDLCALLKLDLASNT